MNSVKGPDVEDQMPAALEAAVRRLTGIDGIGDYIPQVGSNLVYAKADSSTIEDVLALTGRIIATIRGPIACGEMAYGASSHLASVVIEAQKLDGEIRAGLNIKADDDVTRRLKEVGLTVATIPNRVEGEGCPVTQYIRSTGKLADAYVHPGDFGIEPTTTIIARHPDRLAEIMAEIVKLE
jgi:predicted fused transcriptional regulator/phosphomethylpyrimidine kinase